MCSRIEEVEPTVGLPTPWIFRRILQLARPSTDTRPPFLQLFRESAQFSQHLRHAVDTADFRRNGHFVGLFNLPVHAPTRGHPFYSYSENPLHLVAFYDTLWIRTTYSHLKPRGPTGSKIIPKYITRCHQVCKVYVQLC